MLGIYFLEFGANFPGGKEYNNLRAEVLTRQFLTQRIHLNLRHLSMSFCRNWPTRFTDTGSYPRATEGSNLNATFESSEHASRSGAMHSDHRSIGELAYRLWQARGCPEGTAEQDWLEAERQLAGEVRSPEVRLPDVGLPADSAAPQSPPPPPTPSKERSARARAIRSKPVTNKPSSDFAG